MRRADLIALAIAAAPTDSTTDATLRTEIREAGALRIYEVPLWPEAAITAEPHVTTYPGTEPRNRHERRRAESLRRSRR